MPRAMIAACCLVLPGALLSACGRSETPPPSPPRAAEAPAVPVTEAPQDIAEVLAASPATGAFHFEAYAYDCGEQRLVVRPGDGELALILPDRTIVLPQVEAASGAKYAAGDDGFWGKGMNSGILTLAGEEIACQLNRPETPWVDARVRGAVFRGVGQEPGWQLEIHPERIVLIYQYGERRAVVHNTGAQLEPERPVRRWQAVTEAHELSVTVENRACTDVMSGDIFPATVLVRLDGRDYSGCGRELD
jgi:membrane-bound inhibitor of C-type lysozyme/uncharacterized membrane protein